METKKASKNNVDALPTVLAFRRSLELTDAVMSAIGPDGRSFAAHIYGHGKRTTNAYESAKDAGKASAKGDDSRNLSYGYEARLPMDCDTLNVKFGLTVLPVHADPDSCDKPDWMKALGAHISNLRDSDEMGLLGRYYAYNIVNGSWLWRNRDVASGVRVEVQYDDQSLVVDEALDLSLRPVLPLGATDEADPHVGLHTIDGLAEAITQALAGIRGPLTIKVSADVAMMPGQSIWPSQLYIPGKRNVEGTKQPIGREFFTGDNGEPLISKEKVGNALRTFDRHHGDERFPDAIIPIEPNGGSLKFAVNLRRKGRNGSGNTAFDLLPRLVNLSGDKTPLNANERLYLLGCLARGGVYGAKESAGDE